MSNWYKIIKEANKEEFLIKQKPKHLSLKFWIETVKWAVRLSRKHAVWLTNMVKKDETQFNQGEDDQIIKEFLTLFEKAKRRPEFAKKDINQFKSYQELQEALEPYQNVKSNKEKQLDNIKNGIRPIDSKDGYNLYEILSYEAANIVASGTSWCVVHKNYYEDYAARGKIFYVSRENKAYSLLTFASNEFKNRYNQIMTPSETIPIIDLLRGNLEELEIPDNPQILRRSEFSSLIAAEEEIKKMSELYSNISLQDFLGSEKVSSMFTETISNQNNNSNKNVWNQFNILVAIREILPKGGIEELAKNLGQLEAQFPENYIRNSFNVERLEVVTMLHHLTKRYADISPMVKELPEVEKSYYNAFEFLYKQYLDKNLPSKYIKEYDSKSSGELFFRVLSGYEIIPDNLRKENILKMSKYAVDFISKIMYRKNDLSYDDIDVSPALTYQRIPEELRNETIENAALVKWKEIITSDPFTYGSGTTIRGQDIYSAAYEDGQAVKVRVPDKLKKVLKDDVLNIFNELFNSGEVTYNTSYFNKDEYTTLNEFTKRIESGYRLDDVPDFVQKSEGFKKSINFILDNLIKNYDNVDKASGKRSPYSNFNLDQVYNLIEGVNSQVMTPDIYKKIQEVLRTSIAEYDNIYYLEDIPKTILEMPGMDKIIGSSIVNSLSFDNVGEITFLQNNNNNISTKIPIYISELPEFKDRLTEVVLEMMKKRERVLQGDIAYLNSNQLSTLSLYLPDYIVAHPEFDSAYKNCIVSHFENNFRYFLNAKLEMPLKIQGLKESIEGLEKEFADRGQEVPPAIKEHIEQTKENIKKLESQHGMTKHDEVEDLWNSKVYSYLINLTEQETSIFDKNKQDNRLSRDIELTWQDSIKHYPEINDKLKSVYESQKELISLDNIDYVKDIYKHIPGIDIVSRILDITESVSLAHHKELGALADSTLPQVIQIQSKIANLNRESLSHRWKSSQDETPEQTNKRIQTYKNLENYKMYHINQLSSLLMEVDNDRSLISDKYYEYYKKLHYFFPYQSHGRHAFADEIKSIADEYNRMLKQRIERASKDLLFNQDDVATVLTNLFSHYSLSFPGNLY